MKRHGAILMCLTVCLASCTDTVDSVALEYRNANNEAIDALMMVTSEARAADMTARVFSSAADRYKAIEKRLNTVQLNTEGGKPAFAKNVMESDGVHMYLTELEINAQRFTLEKLRLKNLAKRLLEKKREETGDNTIDEDNMSQHFPKLADLVGPSADILSVVRTQLENPKLPSLMEQFPSYKWLNEDDYRKLYDTFEKKRKTFSLKDEKVLVW